MGKFVVGGKTYTSRAKYLDEKYNRKPTTSSSIKSTTTSSSIIPIKKRSEVPPRIKDSPIPRRTIGKSSTTTSIKRKKIEDIGTAAGKALRKMKKRYKSMENW